MLQLEQAVATLTEGFGVPGQTGAGARFVAIAGRDGLRWIIPADIAAASNVLADWTPYKAVSRLAWKAITAASRIGVLPLAPGTRVTSVDFSDVSWRDYGWSRREPPLVITHAGTSGAHQKLVCTLVDRETLEGVLVVKFPVVETAKARLEREFSALEELAHEGRNFCPRPVLLDEQGRFSVQTYLNGRPDGTSIERAHIEFLISLVNTARRLDLGVVRDELARKRAQLSAHGALSDAAANAIDAALAQDRWRGEVPSVRVHGDFAPWNLKRGPEGVIRAVDWEGSSVNALPYLDLHDFRHAIVDTLGRRFTPPWRAYTEALMRADLQLCEEAAATALTAATIKHWMSHGWTDTATGRLAS